MDKTKNDGQTYTVSKGRQGRNLCDTKSRGFIPIVSIAQRNFREQEYVKANGTVANNYDALNEAKIEDMRYYFDDDWFDIPNPGEAIARSLHARALNRGTVNQPLRCSKCKKVYHKKIRPTPGTELYEYLDQGTFGNLRMRVEVCWKCE